jgi:hypothetical protein
MPFTVQVGDERLQLSSARSYAASEMLATPHERHGHEVLIQFTPGVLRADEVR